MLHLGHFSFDGLDKKNRSTHGYFTCIINADSEDIALERFREIILKMKRTNSILDSVVKVYIEDIIKFSEISDEAVITNLQLSEGEFPKSISYTLPSIIDSKIETFGLRENVKKHESTKDDKHVNATPFLIFPEKDQ